MQVERLAAAARHVKPDSLWASPLGRTAATAEAIGRALGLEVRILDDLREMHCGEWEGRSFLDVRASDHENYQKWSTDPFHPCPGGESFFDVQTRMRRALDQIEEHEVVRPMIISHATAIKVLTMDLLDLPLQSARRFLQSNTGITLIERHEDQYYLRGWNDHSHTRGEP